MQYSTIPSIENTVTQPSEAAKIELLTGEEAINTLSSKEFQTIWETLYESCKWATIFQSPDFINTWYQYYRSECLPILVISTHGSRLTGILNLCVLKDNEITGTGGDDAYYHTWLSEEHNKESFIKTALTILSNDFPRYSIRLYQLPPFTPLNWLVNDTHWSKRSNLVSYSRPLVKLNHPDLPKLFSKKQFKENRNRLKRLGEVRYEKVTDIHEFQLIIDELATQYDFRKGATLNISPFRDDPSKKKFLIALFAQGLLHVTVLKMNEDIVASLVATIGKYNWVHGAGINTHAPTYAHFSPGFVSFIMLAQKLSSEKYDCLDLSTGNQDYKARMANTYDEVYELRITHHPPTGVKVPEPIKQLCIKTLSSVGINSKQLRVKLRREKKIAREKWKVIKHQGFNKSAINSLVKTIQNGKVVPYKVILQPAIHESAEVNFQINSIQDLLDYSPDGSLTTRWEFLEDAMRRFEAGEQSYTLSEGGLLLACIWRWVPNAKSRDGHNLIPKGAMAFHEIYCHPKGQKIFTSFFKAVTASLSNPDNQQEIFLITTCRNASLAGVH